jgi:hypothetical protein
VNDLVPGRRVTLADRSEQLSHISGTTSRGAFDSGSCHRYNLLSLAGQDRIVASERHRDTARRIVNELLQLSGYAHSPALPAI